MVAAHGIRVEVDIDTVLRGFRRALKVLGGAADLMDRLGAAVESQTRERFETRRDPDGTAWEPWSARYARRRGGRGALLVRDRHLLDSINYQADAERAVVGANRLYAAIHQFGGQAGRGRKVTIPARPYLGINGADQKDLDEIMADWLRETGLGEAAG